MSVIDWYETSGRGRHVKVGCKGGQSKCKLEGSSAPSGQAQVAARSRRHRLHDQTDAGTRLFAGHAFLLLWSCIGGSQEGMGCGIEATVALRNQLLCKPGGAALNGGNRSTGLHWMVGTGLELRIKVRSGSRRSRAWARAAGQLPSVDGAPGHPGGQSWSRKHPAAGWGAWELPPSPLLSAATAWDSWKLG